MMTRSCALGVMALAILASGCKRPEAQQAETQTQPAQEKPLAATPSAAVPPVLQEAEELAEDVQDSINAGNWAGAQRMVVRIESTRSGLRSTHALPAELAMYDSAVATLATNVAARNQLPADTAANRAGRAVLMMTSHYSPRVPVTAGFMDVAGRDALYRAQLGQWNGVAEAVADLDKNYATVTDHVRSADPALDQRIRADLAALKSAAQAKNVEQVKTISQRVLEEVDQIERTY